MGADKLTKNIPNTPEFICPSPKVWDLYEKRLHWASVVRVTEYLATFKGANYLLFISEIWK